MLVGRQIGVLGGTRHLQGPVSRSLQGLPANVGGLPGHHDYLGLAFGGKRVSWGAYAISLNRYRVAAAGIGQSTGPAGDSVSAVGL